jgi:pimeloyl-ACP methyl ester carboxylesterase
MRHLIRSFLGGLIGVMIAAAPARAADWFDLILSDGTKLKYGIDYPEGFDARKTHPVILALPPGGQSRRMIEWAHDAYWGAEASARGFMVVSPIAPYKKFFYDGGEVYIPELLDQINRAYKVEGEKFHVVGVSNGGLSAFRVALDTPERYRSVTVLSGYPPYMSEIESLEPLRDLPIAMFVGEDDTPWRQKMDELKARFDAMGKDVFYRVVAGNGHEITDLAGDNAEQIFERIRD